ncbi:MAG: Ig-like domain-containing protein [Oscillospiraceae bacterium]|nr:Ig-like domain-containing protein [Oscillospiraceae bacterium]
MKRTISIILAMVMVLSMATISVGAENSIMDTAKNLALNKSETVYLGDNPVVFRLNIPANGKIIVSLYSRAEYTGLQVFNNGGSELKSNKTESSVGEWSWPGYYFSKISSQATTLLWNNFSQQARGTAEYNVQKGMNYARIVSRDVQGECTIKVTFAPNRGATDAIMTATLRRGEQLRLGADLTPANSKDRIAWKSSNRGAVTVSSNGAVRAVARGNADIIAVVNGIELKIRVKVID